MYVLVIFPSWSLISPSIYGEEDWDRVAKSGCARLHIIKKSPKQEILEQSRGAA
jgi:hypothetical protein